MNGSGMFALIVADRRQEHPHDHGVQLAGFLTHFENSPSQLVAIAFLEVGFLELVEVEDRAAVVGRTDADGCGNGGHDRKNSR